MPTLRLSRFISIAPEGIKSFGSRISFAWSTARQEPEIFAFALIQWCAVVVGYFLWAQAFVLIPSIEKAENDPLANLLFFVWSVLIVGLVALPIGIFSGAIGITHFLRHQGLRPMFLTSVSIAARRYWQLWIFSWIDGWITVDQIFDRLPKRDEKTFSLEKAVREALYFAWKSATLGVIPSILNGRNLVDAARESLSLIKLRMRDVLLLRAGYSGLCWLVGLASYLFGLLLINSGLVAPHLRLHILDSIYFFYLYVGIPVCLAAAVVALFLRPIFLLASCELYSELVTIEKLEVTSITDQSVLAKVFSIAIILSLAIATVAILLLGGQPA